MADIALVRSLADMDHYAVVGTLRVSGATQASVVTAGVAEHPLAGGPVVGFVARGRTVKLANIRRNPRLTVVFRSGHEWVTVEGRADLIGPDDVFAGFEPERVPQLLRDVFVAAGGTHDDWAEYDWVMAEDRRCAVLVHPERIYSRPGL
ncbi:MAG TPA: TIGR03618 family F420-dependent PPOX class oxidoreductase [Chloroflexota bacterium]|nr:TIGR03618 family F420-dependent PPOX class oxidoreductase [Chloroflexota bacterium]